MSSPDLLPTSVVSTPNGASPQPDEPCRGHLGWGARPADLDP